MCTPLFEALIRPPSSPSVPWENDLGGCLIENTLQFDGGGGGRKGGSRTKSPCRHRFCLFLSPQDVPGDGTALEGEKVGGILRSLASVGRRGGLPRSEREDNNLGYDVAAAIRMLIARNPPGHERVSLPED